MNQKMREKSNSIREPIIYMSNNRSAKETSRANNNNNNINKPLEIKSLSTPAANYQSPIKKNELYIRQRSQQENRKHTTPIIIKPASSFDHGDNHNSSSMNCKNSNRLDGIEFYKKNHSLTITPQPYRLEGQDRSPIKSCLVKQSTSTLTIENQVPIRRSRSVSFHPDTEFHEREQIKRAPSHAEISTTNHQSAQSGDSLRGHRSQTKHDEFTPDSHHTRSSSQNFRHKFFNNTKRYFGNFKNLFHENIDS